VQNLNKFLYRDASSLDEIGGEQLAGSGFEAQDSKPAFELTECIDAEPQNSNEE
jgi:hypothetical protein